MKSDLYAAINQIASERSIPREAILRGIEDAIITAYRRIAGTDQWNATYPLNLVAPCKPANVNRKRRRNNQMIGKPVV